MPAADAVANLNRASGKTTNLPDNLRFQARVSGIFSPFQARVSELHAHQGLTQQYRHQPYWSRRSSGGLQQRKSQAKPPMKRCDSFSISEDGTADVAPTSPKKRKVALKQKKQDVDKKSPLKNHGFDLPDKNDPKVNLHDSPFKNTRSKNYNPLATLAKANLPIPEIMANEHKKATIRKTTSAASPSHPPQTSPRKRKLADRQENNGSQEPEMDVGDRGESGKSGSGEDEAVEEQEEFHEAVEEQEKNDRDSRTIIVAHNATESAKRKRGRPPSAASLEGNGLFQKLKDAGVVQQDAKVLEQALAERPPEQQETVAQRTGKKTTKVQGQEGQKPDDALLQEYELCRNKFAKGIRDAIDIHDCAILWKNMGGAAKMIRKYAHKGKPKSELGKAMMKEVAALSTLYEKRQAEKNHASSTEQDTSINIALLKLEIDHKLLEPIEDRGPENQKTVEDMFCFLVPNTVLLMKTMLLARPQQNMLQSDTLQEFQRLLRISLGLCRRALRWEPRTNTLEPGIRKWVRNDIAANIKRLQEAYAPDWYRVKWAKDDQLKRKDLCERQKAAREARRQTLESMPVAKREKFYKSIGSREVFGSGHVDDIFDIDDIDDIEEIPVAVGPGDTNVLRKDYRKSKAEASCEVQEARESTIDLPPLVPVDLTDEEKTALLNGLQKFIGRHRYERILKDNELGEILERRDVHDLVNTARSFSQMMASKMGIEAYRADKSMQWLKSADPDFEVD